MSDLKGYSIILDEIENKIAKYVGTRYAVVCSSGRNALRFSLLALGIGNFNEVVIPDFACQTLPIAVFSTSAYPSFCDIDRETCALSPTRLLDILTPNTKAVVFIHPYGFPVDPTPIIEETERRGIFVIDDGAQALGASINGKKVGSFGETGILSFKKFLDVDLGGAVTTNDKELATKIRLIRKKHEQKSFFTSFGYSLMKNCGLKSRLLMNLFFWGDNKLCSRLDILLAKQQVQVIDHWVKLDSDFVKYLNSNGHNSKLSNQLMTYDGTCWHKRQMEEMELIFLNSELENIENSMQRRREVAKMYDENIKGNGFDKICIPRSSTPSYLRYPVVFHDKNKATKSIKALKEVGIQIDYRYTPLHTSPFFGSMIKNSHFEDSMYISERILPLPIKFNMDYDRVKKIASIVNTCLH